jgi:formate dehydrogenase maturation protein FdhE
VPSTSARRRGGPAGSPETVELLRLRAAHPELAPAIDLQRGLLEVQRRVLPRIPLPPRLLAAPAPSLRADGTPLLVFEDLPLDWTDFRWLVRETADLLRRFDELSADAAHRLLKLSREAGELQELAERWFRSRIGPATASAEAVPVEYEPVFALAFRPYLARCAAALAPRLALDTWQRGTCPVCGGEPELAVLAAHPERTLVCGRCSLRWPHDPPRCPFCGNGDRATIRTLASPDRVHWLLACDVCRRYLKAYDERHGGRPAMPPVDTIATLGLDAIALQSGYRS